jgi:saccharopine dehydrogenase-like NADP-dependent oxidoreductase
MKKNVLIIGAGGVAQVVAHKCAQNNDVLGEIHIASRTLSKCEAILESVREKRAMKVDGILRAHAVDAMDSTAVAALIRATGAQIVINVGSAFVNMTVMYRNRCGLYRHGHSRRSRQDLRGPTVVWQLRVEKTRPLR